MVFHSNKIFANIKQYIIFALQIINTMPQQVYVSNYQQYVNVDMLANLMNSNIAIAQRSMYMSVAYMIIMGAKGGFETIVCINIKGKAYRFKYLHNIEAYYNAYITATYHSSNDLPFKNEQKESYQNAFDECVYHNIKKITKTLIKAYE